MLFLWVFGLWDFDIHQFNNFNMVYYFKLTFFVFTLFNFGCRQTNKSTSSYLINSTDFIREEPGGVLILKSFGSGYTQNECIQNAKYNALRDLIFKGIKGSKDPRPLMAGANPEEKYKDYFTKFFAINGPYLDYITTANRTNIDKNDRYEVSGSVGRRKFGSRRAERMTIGTELVVQKEILANEIEKLLFKN